VKDPAGFAQVTIGKDSIRVLAHKDNPVTTLSKEQLKGIFTGTITNWQEVGGPDLPILIVWGTLIPGTNSLFVKQILDGEAQTQAVLETATAADVQQTIMANLEAVGVAPYRCSMMQ
jgi:phosphate transport system substrate-binding protein